MKIRFSIHFVPRREEALYITGSSRTLGEGAVDRALPLRYDGEGLWTGEIASNPDRERIISYKYFVRTGDEGIFYEAGPERILAPSSATREIESRDQWQGNTPEAPFLTAPFSDVFFTDRTTPYTQTRLHPKEAILRITVPGVPPECAVCICGSSEPLGGWNPERAVPMNRLEGVRWEASLPAPEAGSERWCYKFILCDRQNGSVRWEEGPDRTLVLPEISRHGSLIVEHTAAEFSLPNPRYAGIAVPLFSLRSRRSHGIGDFNDLRLLADWASGNGMSLIQLLPINDTTAEFGKKDSYPYNCISVHALHPIYLHPACMGRLNDPEEAAAFEKEGRMLNHSAGVEYEEVLGSKMRFFRALYRQEKENTFAEPGYYSFLRRNREWLYPYALFCTLRDRYGTADFRKWGPHSRYDSAELRPLIEEKNEYSEEIGFHLYLQYHLHKQLSQAREYAHLKGIALKGDIPIGISRNSADAWQYPEYFHFGQQAGAPPDYFSRKGQNWGFPTYNWERMEQDHYRWWAKRFTGMSRYFDAYRIDHILGFFRIWEIPAGYKGGDMGHFHPALPLSPEEIRTAGIPVPEPAGGTDALSGSGKTDPLFLEDPYRPGTWHPRIDGPELESFRQLAPEQQQSYLRLHDDFFRRRHTELWYKNAVRKLQQLIPVGNMLACGEDLGMLDPSVTRCMQNLHILSLEVLQMPKQAGASSGDPLRYPYLSVCTTSTHDSPTLRMWLSSRNEPIPENPEEKASPERCRNILRENLAAPSMLAVFPLQDWLSISSELRNPYPESERINDPSDPDHYWRYRMHLMLEELAEARGLNREITEMIAASGRNPNRKRDH